MTTTTIRTDDPEAPIHATTIRDLRTALDGYDGWEWGGTASFDDWVRWAWMHDDASTLSLAAYLQHCGENPRDYISDPQGRAILNAAERARSEVARDLGRRTSPAKAAAARANGRLGGRPRNTTDGT